MPPLIIITLVKLADSLKMFNKSIVEQGILQTSGKEPFYVISYAFLLDIRLVKAKLFLCSSLKEVSHAASRGSIPVAETQYTLIGIICWSTQLIRTNRYSEDGYWSGPPFKSCYLPYLSWNIDMFEIIAKQCGGLVEDAHRTLNIATLRRQ